MKYTLFIILIILQGLDIYTTNKALKTKIGREINPVMKYAQKYLNLFWGIPKIIIALGIGIGFLFLGVYGLVGLGLIDLFYAYIVYNNFKVLKR